MRKTIPIILPIFLFFSFLFYLHQKIQIYVEAYRLSKHYNYYNELVDKRDYLMYNFSKEVSLAKVNQWAQEENFAPVSRERLLALNIETEEPIASNKIISLLNRFLNTSTSTSTALAKEKR
jgi:hypothetical protein